MKSSSFLIRLLVCLWGSFALFACPLRAQEVPIPLPEMSHMERVSLSLYMENAIKTMLDKPRSGMMATLFLMTPTLADNFKNELGLSDEQMATINASIAEAMEGVEADDVLIVFGQSLGLDALSEDELNTFTLSEEESASLEKEMSTGFDILDDIGMADLTEEQRLKMEEWTFTIFGGVDSPFFDFNDSPVLGLSEEQKMEMQKFTDENAADRKAMLKELSVIAKNTFKNGKLDLKSLKTIGEKFQALVMKKKLRMAEILTPEQMEHARSLMNKMPKFLARQTDSTSEVPAWVPGLNSWKPGDPIPDSSKVNSKKPGDGKKRGFPRKKAEAEESNVKANAE